MSKETCNKKDLIKIINELDYEKPFYVLIGRFKTDNVEIFQLGNNITKKGVFFLHKNAIERLSCEKEEAEKEKPKEDFKNVTVN